MNNPLLVWRNAKWFPALTAGNACVRRVLAPLLICLFWVGPLAAAEPIASVGTPVPQKPEAALDDASAVVAQCLAVEQAFAANDVATLAALPLTDPQWRALRAFRLAAVHIPRGDKPNARAAVRQGLRAVDEGLDSSRAEGAAGSAYRAELLLLGAMLDGQYLLIDRWRMLHNGWRGLRRLRRAERLGEPNLRAQLIRGTAKVVAPWALGGSAAEAVAIFSQANLSTGLCMEGEWAQVDVLNWLGRAQAKLDNAEAAIAAYEAALARSPDNHWVRLALAGEGYEWTEHGEVEAGGENSPQTE